jgi:hypothetical protein
MWYVIVQDTHVLARMFAATMDGRLSELLIGFVLPL